MSTKESKFLNLVDQFEKWQYNHPIRAALIASVLALSGILCLMAGIHK